MRIEEIGGATLVNGDCLEVMKGIPDGVVDLVLCDLPYGTTQNKWDTVIPFTALWDQYHRICKGPVVLTASQPFTSALVMSNLGEFRHEWVWEKNKASGHLNANRRPMQAHEDVLVFCRTQPPYNPQKTDGHEPGHQAKRAKQSSNYGVAESTEYGGSTLRYPRSVIRIPVINNDAPDKTHPTQKPVLLMEYLIYTYSNEGDLVMDNCMGSGTTGVACTTTKRRFLGIEREANYFDIACARIKAVV